MIQCSKLGQTFTGPAYKLLLSFTVISNVCVSFIPNIPTFTKYCPTQWISNLPWSFEIHWVFGIFNGSGGHSKHICLQDQASFRRSRAWQIVLIFNTVYNRCTSKLECCTNSIVYLPHDRPVLCCWKSLKFDLMVPGREYYMTILLYHYKHGWTLFLKIFSRPNRLGSVHR